MEREGNEKLLRRYEAVAPLLDEGLDASEKRRLRARIMEKGGMSGRTLRRYVQKYKAEGYKGLSGACRSDKGALRSVPEAAINEAVKLRQELPSRSVRRIIEILEGEKLIKPGEVSRTSLNRHLALRGYGAAQLRAQGKTPPPAARFGRRHRNSLWQADLKYGPTLTAGGKKKKTYLLAIIDDSTRMVMHSEFYGNQRLPILEDCFRKALMKFGKPKDIYVDNGKIFVSKWFRLACARFGIRHITAKPFSPSSKGKIEKYNKKADEFINEFKLEPQQTLPSLNRAFSVWMDEGYTHDPHKALEVTERDPGTGELLSKRGRTPYQAYAECPAKVRYISSIECRDAFLWEASRAVDKTGCVSLSGVTFDVGAALAGKRVDIRYDPFDISMVEVWHGGQFQRKAEWLSIPESLPKTGGPRTDGDAPPKPTHSRLLKVYREKNAQREKQRNGALSFRPTGEVDG